MSKPSRWPTREARKEHKQKRCEAQRQLRAAQAQRGVLTRLRPKNRRHGKKWPPGVRPNREMSQPAFLATLQALFPELESLPHADTLHQV